MINATKRAQYWLGKAENRLDDGGGDEIAWIDAMRYVKMGNAWAQLAIAETAIQRNNNHNAIMPIMETLSSDKDDAAHYMVSPIEERIKGYIGDYHHATDRATTRESGKAD